MSRLRILFAMPAAALLAITTWAASAQADPPAKIYIYSTLDGHTYDISNAKPNKCYGVSDAYNGSNYTDMTALIYSDKGCRNKLGEAAANGGMWYNIDNRAWSVKFIPCNDNRIACSYG